MELTNIFPVSFRWNSIKCARKDSGAQQVLEFLLLQAYATNQHSRWYYSFVSFINVCVTRNHFIVYAHGSSRIGKLLQVCLS